jgi:hypothetical protein
MPPITTRASVRGMQACLHPPGAVARVVTGSLPRWGRKEPSPRFSESISNAKTASKSKPGCNFDCHFTLVKSLA